MKKLLLALFLLVPLPAMLALPASAQTAITLPIAANAVADLGNGPIKVRMIAGNASIFTAQSSGVGSTSGSSTALTLTGTPATPPLVGGLISGVGITSGTTVAAYNGTTGITLSAAMTVAGGTTVSWGAACPSTPPANVIQASAMADYFIMYTQARVCAVSPGGPVNTLLIEPVFVDSTSGGGGSGTVEGPNSSTVGDVAIWNNTTGTLLKDVPVWSAVAPVGGLPLYASPSGSGTQTCLSAGNSCTLPVACLMIQHIATFLGAVGPINLADGTYTTADINGNQCGIQGNSGGSSSLLASINGNAVTPGNVVIAIQSGQNGFVVQDGGEAAINHLKITNVNGGGPGIQCRQICILDYSDIQWGTWGNSASHVAAYGKGAIVNPGNETLLANTTFLIHWNITDGSMVIPGGTTTIQSSVSWSALFAAVGNGGTLDTTGWTVSGTGTGPQFSGSGIGFLASGATPCASVFPGTGGCVLNSGFQTSAGDNPTSPVPAGGATCTLTTVSHLTVVKGVVTLCN